MKIRLIGLGKMGANLALNMKDHNIDVIGFDLNKEVVEKLKAQNVTTTTSLKDLLTRQPKEKLVVWLLVPNTLVDTVIGDIKPFLTKGDIIVDGGNSNFNQSMRRFDELQKLGISFLDVGTSGGTMGARHGACLMIGGLKETFDDLEDVFKKVSCENGYAYMGKSGSGHFVKMVHNGIEYGMMQAIAEGFDLFESFDFDLDYEKVCQVWNNGSIIESVLIEYTKNAFAKDAKLDEIEGRIDDSGEGMWMIQEALKKGVSIPVIAQSLFTRFKSRDNKFAEKVVAAQRNEFGGHMVYKKK